MLLCKQSVKPWSKPFQSLNKIRCQHRSFSCFDNWESKLRKVLHSVLLQVWHNMPHLNSKDFDRMFDQHATDVWDWILFIEAWKMSNGLTVLNVICSFLFYDKHRRFRHPVWNCKVHSVDLYAVSAGASLLSLTQLNIADTFHLNTCLLYRSGPYTFQRGTYNGFYSGEDVHGGLRSLENTFLTIYDSFWNYYDIKNVQNQSSRKMIS